MESADKDGLTRRLRSIITSVDTRRIRETDPLTALRLQHLGELLLIAHVMAEDIETGHVEPAGQDAESRESVGGRVYELHPGSANGGTEDE